MPRRFPVAPPLLLSRLVGFNAQAWIVRGLSFAKDDPRFYAVSLLEEYQTDSLFSIELVFDEFEAFCAAHGIPRPAPVDLLAARLLPTPVPA